MSKNKLSQVFWYAAGVAAILLILFTYFAATWSSIKSAQAAIDTCSQAFCDFSEFYYRMGQAVFTTDVPITGFVYSPFIAILVSVFPLLGLNISLVVWGVLQILAIFFYLFLFHRLVPAKLPIQLLFITLTLSSFPLLHILSWGQVGLFTIVAILAALYYYERGQLVIAACLIAFAISFKFFPFVFLILFVIRRDFRFTLMSLAACGLFLFIIPGIVFGIEGMLHFYSVLFGSYQHFDWVITNYNSQYFPNLMLRMVDAIHYDAHAYLPVLRCIAYMIAFVNLTLVYRIWRAQVRLADLWGFHIIFLSIPFIMPTSWPADLVYLPFGQAFLFWWLLNGRESSHEDIVTQRRHRIILAVQLVLLLISVIFSNIAFFNFIGDRILFGSLGFIFWSNLLVLVASYLKIHRLINPPLEKCPAVIT